MITAPNWAKGAYPTTRGWEKDGELLKAMKISQADVDEWFGTEVDVYAEIDELPEYLDVTDAIVDTPEQVEDLTTLTKQELEEYARENGVELDKRMTKDSMIKEYLALKE